ncbi:hypothetical protein PUN28_000788 [Cardiocondyla obscurior]|uniref:Uncharacterized protein n=1 Tax=Cardiocondyla obscurior TaxID=286306 RepID=A0AAW2H1L7_9HYME
MTAATLVAISAQIKRAKNVWPSVSKRRYSSGCMTVFASSTRRSNLMKASRCFPSRIFWSGGASQFAFHAEFITDAIASAKIIAFKSHAGIYEPPRFVKIETNFVTIVLRESCKLCRGEKFDEFNYRNVEAQKNIICACNIYIAHSEIFENYRVYVELFGYDMMEIHIFITINHSLTR